MIADGGNDFVTNAKDGLLPRRANPEVPPIEQVIDPMLLRRDGIVERWSMNLQGRGIDLVSTRRARVRSNRARDTERRLLPEMIRRLEHVISDGRLRHDGLDDAGAVSNLQEVNLAARAAVVQPAVDRDLLAFVR